ncbi:hypothetical protein D9M68_788370 [compost metagenome]
MGDQFFQATQNGPALEQLADGHRPIGIEQHAQARGDLKDLHRLQTFEHRVADAALVGVCNHLTGVQAFSWQA